MDGFHKVDNAREVSAQISRTEPAGRADRSRSRAVFHRFAKFSAVGAGGVIVQTVTLAVLLRVGGMHYLPATALAVEASILHNFVWHRRWTWADRPRFCAALVLLRFNATNGAISLIGNLALMFILVSVFKLNPYVSNLMTVGICSFVNFAVADKLVFT
jgi:putative flippase GtrA